MAPACPMSDTRPKLRDVTRILRKTGAFDKCSIPAIFGTVRPKLWE